MPRGVSPASRSADGSGMRALLISLIAALCCGCFVLDELDQGEVLMEQASSRGGANKKKAAAEAEAQAPRPRAPAGKGAGDGLLDTAKGWWSKLSAPAHTEPDPNDGVVRCRIDGSVQFMRASDCQVRGGDSA
jgi:hypothetical protein